MRLIRRDAHREPSREISVRPRRILQDPVPEPAHEVREASPPATLVTDRQLPSDRTALFREASWEDAHRNANPRHAALR